MGGDNAHANDPTHRQLTFLSEIAAAAYQMLRGLTQSAALRARSCMMFPRHRVGGRAPRQNLEHNTTGIR